PVLVPLSGAVVAAVSRGDQCAPVLGVHDRGGAGEVVSVHGQEELAGGARHLTARGPGQSFTVLVWCVVVFDLVFGERRGAPVGGAFDLAGEGGGRGRQTGAPVGEDFTDRGPVVGEGSVGDLVQEVAAPVLGGGGLMGGPGGGGDRIGEVVEEGDPGDGDHG